MKLCALNFTSFLCTSLATDVDVGLVFQSTMTPNCGFIKKCALTKVNQNQSFSQILSFSVLDVFQDFIFQQSNIILVEKYSCLNVHDMIAGFEVFISFWIRLSFVSISVTFHPVTLFFMFFDLIKYKVWDSCFRNTLFEK